MYNNRKMIALCISRANEKRNFEVIASLNAAANQYGYKLFVYHTCSNLYQQMSHEEGEKKIFDLMDFDILDAVVVMEEAFYDKQLIREINDRAAAHGTPVISIGDTDMDCIRFVFGYVEGFEKVVRHMIEGHQLKDALMVAGAEGELFSERRIHVFQKVLEENGIPFSEDNVIYGNYWWKPTEQAMEAFLESGGRPRAIICANDSMAITVCNVLRRHDIRVPEDVIVSGFDGTEQGRTNLPSITTSGCDFYKVSQKIMDVLQQMFAGKEVEKRYEIPYEIEINASCGCQLSAAKGNSGLLLNETNDHFYRYQESERRMYEIGNRILYCITPQDISKALELYPFGQVAVMVNQAVFDETINPEHGLENEGFDEKMFLLHHTGAQYADGQLPLLVEKKDRLAMLSDFIASENPLIFSSLSYGENPLGYLCFCYDVSKKEYDFIQQQTDALSNALSSYRTLRHIRFVTRTMEEISRHDSMTGLYNRKGFYEGLKELVDNAPKDARICVASIDLDGLKTINDCHGHESGDFAICAVADALMNVSLPEDKIVARFGGDEMVLCCATMDESQTVSKIRQDINAYLEKINQTAGKVFRLSASIGICTAPVAVFGFEDILRQSDVKMYQEKKEKNHRIE